MQYSNIKTIVLSPERCHVFWVCVLMAYITVTRKLTWKSRCQTLRLPWMASYRGVKRSQRPRLPCNYQTLSWWNGKISWHLFAHALNHFPVHRCKTDVHDCTSSMNMQFTSNVTTTSYIFCCIVCKLIKHKMDETVLYFESWLDFWVCKIFFASRPV